MSDNAEILNGAGLLGPGCLVLVVGPSGAGKDTLIGYAREHLETRDYVFPRRVITRPADPDVENHSSVTVKAFQSMRAKGDFALHWEAHGLCYGIPRSIDDHITAGRSVLVNVSRSIVATAFRRYGRLLIVEVTAPAALLAARLGLRGREDAVAIEHRLARKGQIVDGADFVRIVNDGPVEQAGNAFVVLLEDLIAERQF